jgi:hypothetical protein
MDAAANGKNPEIRLPICHGFWLKDLRSIRWTNQNLT